MTMAQREQAAAVAMAVQPGIDRPAILSVEGVGAPGQIGTSAEAAARTREYDSAHIVVAVGAIHGIEQFRQHPAGEGIQLVRTIQRDSEDAVLGFVLDLLVVHSASSFDGCTVTSD
jgi:hypothetical protein